MKSQGFEQFMKFVNQAWAMSKPEVEESRFTNEWEQYLCQILEFVKSKKDTEEGTQETVKVEQKDTDRKMCYHNQ